MRYIPLKKHKPDQLWIKKAEKLLADLTAETDDEKRKKIIDDNSQVWGELKEWLLELSHQKCWFSEAKDCFNHWDVEHYRPKKSAKDEDGTEHGGYWWLAFDWENFRICGNVGNRKKGTYFPLHERCNRAKIPDDDLREELPLLLDPADAHDPSLLSFNVLGEAIPRADITDVWEKRRVESSVLRFKLDFRPLEEKRKTVWNECWDRIKRYRDDLQRFHDSGSTNKIVLAQYTQAVNEIHEMLCDDQELSAVARACILSTGDPRVIALLQIK